MSWIIVFALSFGQNLSFTMVSRARNRDSMTYHALASVFSNAIWFLTMREVIMADLSLDLLVPYTIGTTAGSLFGAKVSIKIERAIGALADPR